jgi:D-aminopeptidase
LTIESDAIDPIFVATIDAVEEAVLRSLCMAETTTGRNGRVVRALDLQQVRAVLARYPGVGVGTR